MYVFCNNSHFIVIEQLKRNYLDAANARRNASAYWLNIFTGCMGKWYIKRWFNDDGY
jgi:hypothetical protein